MPFKPTLLLLWLVLATAAPPKTITQGLAEALNATTSEAPPAAPKVDDPEKPATTVGKPDDEPDATPPVGVKPDVPPPPPVKDTPAVKPPAPVQEQDDDDDDDEVEDDDATDADNAEDEEGEDDDFIADGYHAPSSSATAAAKKHVRVKSTAAATGKTNATATVHAADSNTNVTASPINATNATADATNATDATEDDSNKNKPDDEYGDDLLHIVDPLKSEDDDDGSTPSFAFPQEDENQPREWPIVVVCLFVVAALAMVMTTAVRNCRRRADYQVVPEGEEDAKTSVTV